LKIFEKEIDRVLLEQKNELTLNNKNQIADLYTPEITALESDIANLTSEIDAKEAFANELYETYIAEAEGRKGTLLVGKGPVYKEKREKHDTTLAELQQLKQENRTKIADKEDQIAQLQAAQKDQESTSQPIIDGFDGLMARINALQELPWLPSFFIFLLFLAIETAPIFAKLISPKGEYDYKLQDIEDAVKTWVSQKVHQRDKVLATDTVLNEKIYNDIADEEELYTYKKQRAREIMQIQADAFYKGQKRIVE
jgi:Mg2+ and Co2+ transporter CorA